MKPEKILKAKEHFISKCVKRRYHLIEGFDNRFAIVEVFLDSFRSEGFDTFEAIKYYNQIKSFVIKPSGNIYKNFYEVFIKMLDDMIRVSKVGAFL